MAGEEQERFEDYLELERYIEQLRQGQVAHPPANLTPAKARIYRMVALFRSAAPQTSELRPEFAAELQARLEQMVEQPEIPQHPLPTPAENKPKRLGSFLRRSNLSRRAMVTGGAVAAASLLVGAGIEKSLQGNVADKGATPGAAATNWNQPLVDVNQGSWLFVAKLADLGDQALRFATDAVVGYVIRNDDFDTDPAPIIAFSAACTHMGCIVQWQGSDRQFHCPCHGGLFTEYGGVNTTAATPVRYLAPLPRLRTKIENDAVYVEVPNPSTSVRASMQK